MDLFVLCWWGKRRVGAELRVQSLEFRFGMPAARAYFFIVRCREGGTNLPFACRGEHCSPVAFTRWVSLTGWLHGRHSSRAYKPTRYIRYNIRSRAGDPAPPKKPSPKGGRWRGTRRMRGICPGVAPSSVTYGDSFPQRGKPYRRFTRAFGVTVKSRAGHAPPLRGGGFVYSNIGRGDPTPPKSLPQKGEGGAERTG